MLTRELRAVTHNQRMRFKIHCSVKRVKATSAWRRIFAGSVLALSLGACSPALNWRNVPVNDAHLTVSLPCKPDHATRPVALGARQVDLSMVGCEAQGGLYALSYMTLSDPGQISETLTLWRAAVRVQLGLPAKGQESQESQEGQAGGKGSSEVPFVRKGALNVPQSVRMRVTGKRADGSAVQADAVWFARLNGSTAQLVHAVVFADTLDTKAADNFFESIALQ